MNNRIKIIMSLIPRDVRTILDVGSKGDIFKGKGFKVKTLDVLERADIVQDLNKSQKLNLEDNSFDLVVLNQILEHLPSVEELIKEVKRVSRKYLFVGLPNEAVYSLRIKFLFGKIESPGYQPYGHKHRFGIRESEEFIKKFFGKYEKKVYFGAFTGASFLPKRLIQFLADLFPSLFSKETYYLIKIK